MNPLKSLGRGLEWLGRSLHRDGRADQSTRSFNGPNNSGVPVTPDRALSLSACYAAINVLSRDLASLPVDVYREGANGPAIEDRRRRELLRFTPDGERTAFRFRQSLIAHALTYGNGLAEIERSLFSGAPLALHLLDPRQTRAVRSSRTGKVYYEQDRGEAIRAEDVVHFAPLGFDGLNGISPIKLCQQAVGLGMALENFGAAFFGNGAKPGGFIKHPKRMTPEAAGRLRDSIERIHAGSEQSHRLAVLEEGAEWTATTIPPDEAQFLASRGFQVLEIARLYNLPPHKLGDWSQSHLASVEEGNIDYATTTLMPWCVSMENEWDLKLFVRDERLAGLHTRHDMTALLRGNMAARGAFYQILLQWGIVTPNEVARREGLPPIGPAGDVHLLPLNTGTLEQAGKPDPKEVKRNGALARRLLEEIIRSSPEGGDDGTEGKAAA